MRRTLLLCCFGARVNAVLAPPSFDRCLQRGLGSWRGAGFTWTPDASASTTIPVAVAPGHITVPSPCSSDVLAEARGAVHAMREERQPSGGVVVVSQQSSTCFSCGSWCEAPRYLGDAGDEDHLASALGFGVSVNIAHGDETRKRLLLAVVGGSLASCDVYIEGRAGVAMPESAATLLQRRLQVVVDAKAWEGGMTRRVLSGSPDDGSGWSGAAWEVEESAVEGGAPLLPPNASFQPGGCWVRVVDAVEGGAEEGLVVEVGSLSLESGEVKVVRQKWTGAGGGDGLHLTSVQLSEVTAEAE